MEKKVFKPTGLMPRSIPRTVRRFFQQLQPESEQKALAEFRVSRYQAIVSVQCLLTLVCIPLLVTWILKTICIRPVIENAWNTQNRPIFLNAWQEHRAFLQLQEYSDQRFFDQLLIDENVNLIQLKNIFDEGAVKEDLQREFIHLADQFNTESITTLTNIMSDLCCFGVFLALYNFLRPQRTILQPIGWELSLETLIQHFGFAPNEDFVFLIVATVPVFLSTVFKYGIFRYLNRVSPSTVAIYHNMIE